ncbi:MAG: phosphoribosylaminoimidazolesuccinocarboxamide synthase, partial [Acidimicrobiia bacterium]
MLASPLCETSFDNLKLYRRGKVRDVYEAGDRLLMVATDRISAFDHVLGSGIPDKGKVLTQLSAFWFDKTRDIVPNHLISSTIDDYPEALRTHAAALEGRSMLVMRTEPLPLECVARGYLEGSGWKAYRETGAVCGIKLPQGLRQADRLPTPIFTPATKAETGHDVNIDQAEASRLVGDAILEQLRRLTLLLYARGVEHAARHGIIIADTKFEFGLIDGRLVLIDEVLTPDSSRFWPADRYQPGQSQPSYDKQFVRDYLEAIHWNKQPPVPSLPVEVVE